jgi:hypothetical protein
MPLLLALSGAATHDASATPPPEAPSRRDLEAKAGEGDAGARTSPRRRDAHPKATGRTARLRALSIDLATELVHVTIGHRGRGDACAVSPSYETALRTKRGQVRERTEHVAAAFAEALAALGAPPPAPAVDGFDVDGPSVDLGVFGSVRSLARELCEGTRADDTRSRTEAEVTWYVFDHHTQRTLYVTTTRGVAEHRARRVDTDKEVAEALAQAAARLASDGGIRRLVDGRDVPEPHARRLRSAPPLRVAPSPAKSDGGFKQRLVEARDATVGVSTAFGHQSGVLVAPGLVVTHADLVIGAKIRVRIGSVRVRGELLRHAPAHRVALVRVIVDDDAKREVERAAPMAAEPPETGSSVYLLAASPDRSERTVSAGIVSARRAREGTPIYQTDAIAHDAGRGGPVLNERGEVVGLTSGGVRGSLGDDVGINYFLPLEDVLRGLDVELAPSLAKEQPEARVP